VRPRSSMLALVLMMSATPIVPAQQPAPPQLAFDVVSIKPSRSGAVAGGFGLSPNGRVEWTNTTLRALLRMAYQRFGFDPREILGGPAWIDSDRFDVIATAERPPQTDPNGFPEGLLGMIRAFVEDRFKVKVHNEQRDAQIYALVLARGDGKTGSALRSVPDACATAMKAMTDRTPRSGPPPCSFRAVAGQLIGTGVTLTMFGNVLSGYVGRTVLDRTALPGSFDIDLTFDPASAAKTPPGAPPGPTVPDDTAPSIFTALQEQHGLKLESTRGRVDVLVVDAAEPPTPD
jgi:uncharacterized protein (TIGR03435 family)